MQHNDTRHNAIQHENTLQYLSALMMLSGLNIPNHDTLSIMKFSTMKFSTMTLSIMTLSIMTINIMPLSFSLPGCLFVFPSGQKQFWFHFYETIPLCLMRLIIGIRFKYRWCLVDWRYPTIITTLSIMKFSIMMNFSITTNKGWHSVKWHST